MHLPVTFLFESLLFISFGAAIALPIILFNIKVAPRWGWIDWPKARGVADHQTPIVGHSLIFLSLIYFVIAWQYLHVSPWFVTMAFIMAIMGYFDDKRPVPALDKLGFQVICVVSVVLFDPNIHESMSVKFGSTGTFLAIFFILGLINAINFVDGIDGLAGVVLLTGSLGYTLFAYNRIESYPYVLFSLLLAGMLLPFLYLNVVKRKGFLGNIGSYFFAYVLGVMHLSLPIDTNNSLSRISLSGLCFIVPIADAMTVIVTRVLTRRSPFQPDKGHLHHRLVQTSLLLRYVLMAFGLIQISAVVVAYALFKTEGARNSPALTIVVLICFVAIVSTLIVLVEKATKKRLQSYFQMLDNGETVYFLKYQVRKQDGSILPFHVLARLEAKMNAEIRVTDLCYLEEPDTLFVTLKTSPQRLKPIANRLDLVFQTESVKTNLVIEQGEFVKVAHFRSPNALKAASL